MQTRLIKHSVEKWLTDTDIMNIRKTLPDLPDDLDDEEKKKRMEQQAKENLSKMFDAIAEEHPDETVELLGLLCFVPLDETNDHPMNFYFESITELLNDQSVWSFFSSLVMAARRLGITQA